MPISQFKFTFIDISILPNKTTLTVKLSSFVKASFVTQHFGILVFRCPVFTRTLRLGIPQPTIRGNGIVVIGIYPILILYDLDDPFYDGRGALSRRGDRLRSRFNGFPFGPFSFETHGTVWSNFGTSSLGLSLLKVTPVRNFLSFDFVLILSVPLVQTVLPFTGIRNFSGRIRVLPISRSLIIDKGSLVHGSCRWPFVLTLSILDTTGRKLSRIHASIGPFVASKARSHLVVVKGPFVGIALDRL
mmetsp:Transcript_18318/g.34802  ORF Transcript_18318/g.34802 Transcript_18318/m.34802 type:complete len:245 (+) Transcript_18318:1286-2020(+)